MKILECLFCLGSKELPTGRLGQADFPIGQET